MSSILQDASLIKDVMAITERTLNFIDVRLCNHGRRVAYIVFQMLWPTGRYTLREMQDICIIALLHDVGAYKTEEIDQMVQFETEETLEHSIYGYLFFKHFSPLKEFSPVLLHHHTPCTELDISNPLDELAQVIFIADRIDILTVSGFDTKEKLYKKLNEQRDILFSGEILDKVLAEDLQLPVRDEDVLGDSIVEKMLHIAPLSQSEVSAYLEMIVLFIDMRSHQTLTHTISTTSISESLAGLMGVSAADTAKLVAASWLHDIGKIGVPLQVLEKPTSLTKSEMRTIEKHVDHTAEILAGTVEEDVRFIAAHHHEKLDGSGYPDGLREQQLSLCQRILVVADIFSALCGVRSYKHAFEQSEVEATLLAMTHGGLLDAGVVQVALQNYEEIRAAMEKSIRPYESALTDIIEEFASLRGKPAW